MPMSAIQCCPQLLGHPVLGSDASPENRSANVGQPGLLLCVNADMIPMDVCGNLFRLGGIERETEARLEFGEEGIRGPPMLEKKEFQARFFTALAKNFAFAEVFRDAAHDRHHLLPLDEGVERNGEVRVRG